MKRTGVSTLILLGILGTVSGAFLETVLASSSRPIIIPEVGLPVALVAIAVIVILLAVPIRRFTHGKGKGPIDPDYAMRVVMLAKACALSGSLLAGMGLGVTLYLLTRSATPAAPIGLAVSTFVGAAILLAAGLIAESMCIIPPSDPDDDSGKKPIRVRP